MRNSTKLTSMIASVLITGSVALAFLPAPSPQPTSPWLAVSAAMAPITLDAQSDCEDECRATAIEELDNAVDEAQECTESAEAIAAIANNLCDLLSDPGDVAACKALVAAALAQESQVCRDEALDLFNNIFATLAACLAACA